MRGSFTGIQCEISNMYTVEEYNDIEINPGDCGVRTFTYHYNKLKLDH